MSEIHRKDPVTLQDDLSESNIWPVYPEIAEQHQLTGSLTWRLGRSTNYQTLDLDQFIEASFQKLAEKPLPQLPDFPVWKSRINSLAAELSGVGNTQSQIG